MTAKMNNERQQEQKEKAINRPFRVRANPRKKSALCLDTIFYRCHRQFWDVAAEKCVFRYIESKITYAANL